MAAQGGLGQLDATQGQEMRRRSDVNLYLTVAAPVFFGLFFLEYPPLFIAGYWNWGGLVHKVLSGIFLLSNLAIAEFMVRRSRSRSNRERDAARREGASEPVVQPAEA
jgi:hypothetical protein